MKDYNVQIKVRNNFLMTVMKEKGIDSGSELARRCDITAQDAGRIINLKESAYLLKGDLRTYVAKICESLSVSIDQIYPPQHINDPLTKNVNEIEVSIAQLEGIENQSAAENLLISRDISCAIDGALDKLTDRQKDIIEMRFFENRTLMECAEKYGLTGSRVMQIEAKSLRILRHRADKSGELVDLMELK